MAVFEINFDGIVGPTHHFGGLGSGNLASHAHAGQVANPQAAALQGLDKIALLDSLGCRQAVLPPQWRPDFRFLRACGFSGNDRDVLRRAADADISLLSAAYSASSMWTANAATVTRSAANGITHFTPANLTSSLHRAIEPPQTTAVLRKIFDSEAFVIHDSLPASHEMRDEGAANHMRLTDRSGLLVWDVFVSGSALTKRFMSRQSRMAFEAIARQHRLDPKRTYFLNQRPDAIDAGAFHNDVVATSCENVLLMHEFAFEDGDAELERLSNSFQATTGSPLVRIVVSERELSLSEAIETYLFNSQIVRPAGESGEAMVMICPSQCVRHAMARAVIDRILADENPVESVQFVDLNQSMNNGGGPACLRLRVPVDDHQAAAIDPSVIWSNELAEKLRHWITEYYPTRLHAEDLGDWSLVERTSSAMQALAKIIPCVGASPN